MPQPMCYLTMILSCTDFTSLKTTYLYQYAASGRNTGSRWTERIVLPKGERFFVLMDKIDSINDSFEG